MQLIEILTTVALGALGGALLTLGLVVLVLGFWLRRR